MTPPRLFPPPSPDLYTGTYLDATRAEFPVGATVLARARALSSRSDRWLGRRLEAAGRLARLLHFHACALASENAGQWVRAEFFFRNARRQAVALDRDNSWEQIELGGTGRKAREAVSSEVLIDVQHALYAGCLAGGWATFGSRAAWHLMELIRWVTWAGWDQTARERLLRPLLLDYVLKAIAADDWKMATEFGRQTFTLFPDLECRERLALVYFTEVVRASHQSTTPGDASGAIKRISELAAGAPTEATYYDWLAQLHLLQAYHEASKNSVSAALEHCGRALAYEPSMSQASEALEALSERMVNLQKTMAAAIANLGYNQRLNWKGLALKADADRGFSRLSAFRESPEAAALEANRVQAIALAIWRSARLGEPATPELPSVFLRELERVWGAARKDPATIPQLARSIVATEPRLKELNPVRVETYLRRRIVGGETTQDEPEPVLPVASSAHPITPGPRAASQRVEPLGYWVFAREGWWLKALIAAAIILFAVTAVLSVRERSNRGARNRLYHEMVEAEARQDYLGTIEAAERFLSRGTIGRDGRDPEVRATFTQGLTRWFTSEAPSTAEAEPHLAKYRRLVLQHEERKS
jgi:hypothetical protein